MSAAFPHSGEANFGPVICSMLAALLFNVPLGCELSLPSHDVPVQSACAVTLDLQVANREEVQGVVAGLQAAHAVMQVQCAIYLWTLVDLSTIVAAN